MSELLSERKRCRNGDILWLTLNRPQALNALTHEMCQGIDDALFEAQSDDTIAAVVMTSAKPKCFCAGGDVRRIVELAQNNTADAMPFFETEYRMNERLHQFPKPYFAILDGITMGGGAGISLHGRYPIATEHLTFAMPEARIGFYPDVGGSYLLARAPQAIGIYLGLTGIAINAADAVDAGLLRYCIAHDNLDALYQSLSQIDLSDADAIQTSLQALHQTPNTLCDPQIAPMADTIERIFSQESVQDILQSLQDEDTPWANETLTHLEANSPTSLVTTLALMRQTKGLSFSQIMQRDRNLTQRFLEHPDFHEGVRAALIDKDKQPRWASTSQDLTKQS